MRTESDRAAIAAALRFGWSLAEVRGRNWCDGPRPTSTPLPPPTGALPLRSQRSAEDAREGAVHSLVALAHEVGFADADAFVVGLHAVVPSFDAAGATLLGSAPRAQRDEAWATVSDFFYEWDARIQDDLARRDDLVANAYLLGRGLAECYWALGPDDAWTLDGTDTAVSLAFLLGPPRRAELTRMLGRLGPELGNPMTASAVSGSLEAWGAVAAEDDWSHARDLRERLYEQVRRWYQLLVLQQDPTTLLKPYARLSRSHTLFRTARAFAPQLVLGAVAVGLITAFFALTGGSSPSWVKSVLATGGVGTFAVAGLVTRAKNAAQQLAVRLRQDVYTDLVAVDVSIVPPYPGGTEAAALKRAKRFVEHAVHQRTLTPPTPAPDIPV